MDRRTPSVFTIHGVAKSRGHLQETEQQGLSQEEWALCCAGLEGGKRMDGWVKPRWMDEQGRMDGVGEQMGGRMDG